ncbi:MAG: DNA primase [Clostridiaceae bacterium]|jgi:DNA primase|nr:DNA primase [Clostridiaceae bacterium]
MEELKSKNRIVDVVSGYMELNKNGGRYFGCCPFHHEKTASFCVNEGDEYYHCFGCGASGDVVRFIREIENKSFIEAIHFLADRAGMEMPELSGEFKDAKEKKKKREILYEITLATAKFYLDNFYKEGGAAARSYVAKRGLSEKIAANYGLGYSPDQNSLSAYLKYKAFPETLIKESGAVEPNSGRDPMAGRLIVPIINQDGNIIGFGGRILTDAKDVAKYKNTAASELFDKGRSLFGLNVIKKEKQAGRLNRILVVEGYMDVISLANVGIHNAVAGMGTAFTPYQARAVLKWCGNVSLIYDGDSAGRKAALKTIEVFAAEGVKVNVVALPDGMDPDDAAKSMGRDAFLRLVDTAPDHIEYKLSVIAEKHDLTSSGGRAAYVRDATAMLAAIKNPSEREVYLQIVQEKARVSLESLTEQTKNNASRTDKKVPAPQANDPKAETEGRAKKPAKGLVSAEDFILNSLLFQRSYASVADLRVEWFSEPLARSVFKYVADCAEKGKKPVPGSIFEFADDTAADEAARVLHAVTGFKSDVTARQFFTDSALTLANAYLDGETARLSRCYENAQDAEAKRAILTELATVQKRRASKDLDGKY